MSETDLSRPFAERIVRRLRDAGRQSLFAGGCVRDLLLGRTPKDYDVATDARPEAVRALFGHGRTLAVGESFGVVVVVPSKADRDRGVSPVEVATFRTEGPYRDGRRPEAVSFATPEEDAKRRDFTINGMFLDPLDNRVLDFVGGEADLGRRLIRAIGDPRERMTEDKLRLLRAVRFAATLEFGLDPATADAVREMAGQLTVVSAERITQELRQMLTDPHRRRAVELCDGCGLLDVILPEFRDVPRRGDASAEPWRWTLATLELLKEPSFPLALAVLLTPTVADLDGPSLAARTESVARRLRLSNADADRLAWLLAHRASLDGIRHARPSRLKRLCVEPGIGELLELARAKAVAAKGSLDDVGFVQAFLRDTPAAEFDPPPLLTGGDLIAAGLRPGPAFKTLLDVVRDAQLDGAIGISEEAIALARQLNASGVTGTK